MEREMPQSQKRSSKEFIALMALLMSLVALGTDAMLPAMEAMGKDLGVGAVQDLHLIVTILFLGMALGQVFYGPLSDQIGRKNGIYLGLVLFLIGSVMSFLAKDFSVMLLGRFLQGLGAAGSKIVVVAMIRDLFAGAAMARIMSFIMGVFILIPVLAPIMGQAIFLWWGWRAIFLSFIFLGLLGGLWLAGRQQETLHKDRRIRVTPANLWAGTRQTFTTPTALGYMVASGIIFGPFIGYLSSSQQIFQSIYQVGTHFPYYFAALAVSIGLASVINGRFVMTVGMHKLVRAALLATASIAALFLIIASFYDFKPPLALFMGAFTLLFFAMGILFGNLNSLAMSDVGDIAGIASAWIGAVSTFLAMALAWLVGLAYDGTLFPLGFSFLIASLLTLFIVSVLSRANT